MLPITSEDGSEKLIPFSIAQVFLRGNQGDIVKSNTDQNGEWSANSLLSSWYLLEAQKDEMVIKQVFSIQSESENLVPKAGVYTSCQVMVYEVANRLFENALYLWEVPDLVIPESLVNDVEKVYREGCNPFDDPDIIHKVEELVSHQF